MSSAAAVAMRSESLSLDVCRFDQSGPFVDLALDEFLEIFGRPALGRNQNGAELLQSLLGRTSAHRNDSGILELLHDRCGRALGQDKGKPGAGVEISKALLVRGRQIRKDRRAVFRQNRDRLDRVALDVRDREFSGRAW